MSEAKLFTCTAKNLHLADAVDAFVKTLSEYKKHYALLYAPRKCFLAIVDSSKFRDEQNKEIDVRKEAVFEARVFNETAELRWLNETNGTGKTVVLCEDPIKKFFDGDSEPFKPMNNELVGTTQQTYLLWGESVGASDSNDWTRFAEARIGSFFVPVGGINANKKQRAQITAVEYLGEYEDGNVAVAEERLRGIEVVPTEEKNHG